MIKYSNFFTENKFIAANQSTFKPGDSCTSQLLSITYDIYKPFDEGYEVRRVFFNISKAFDKVWQSGIPFKLKQNVISREILELLSEFLKVGSRV